MKTPACLFDKLRTPFWRKMHCSEGSSYVLFHQSSGFISSWFQSVFHSIKENMKKLGANVRQNHPSFITELLTFLEGFSPQFACLQYKIDFAHVKNYIYNE